MIPFPGESVALGNTSPSGLYTNLLARAGSEVLASGDQWRVWVYPGETTYLEEPAAAVAVSWVVEVTGGSGTVTASWGFDPTYSDDTAATPYPLGSHTVTGPTTLVLPTTLTADDVLNHPDAFQLRLDGSSGSVTVQQVKLRVWPTAGAAGGWSDEQPGFDTAPVTVTPYWTHSSIEVIADSTTAGGAWDAGYAAWPAAVAAATAPTSRTFNPAKGSSEEARVILTAEGPDSYTMGLRVFPVHGLLRGRSWQGVYPIAGTLTDGVDFIRPPEEVAGDYAAYAQQIGPGSTGWIGAHVTVAMGSDGEAGSPTLYAYAGDLAITPGTGSTLVFTGDISAGSPGSSWDLPTSGRDIYWVGSHTLTSESAVAWPGVTPGVLDPYTLLDEMDFQLGYVQSFASLPPYRVWLPTVVDVQPLRLMQRGDGLGMGSGRLLGAGTRQSSTRLFGSL